ncbi:hypothetical protein CF328_g2610 [Tilletia controversa]|nr:hypothetical protein CF328_g2610 [Tilletia controversa]
MKDPQQGLSSVCFVHNVLVRGLIFSVLKHAAFCTRSDLQIDEAVLELAGGTYKRGRADIPRDEKGTLLEAENLVSGRGRSGSVVIRHQGFDSLAEAWEYVAKGGAYSKRDWEKIRSTDDYYGY